MPRGNFTQKVSDADIALILLADAGSDWRLLARRLGVHVKTIGVIRARKTRSSLRVADSLGVVARAAPRCVFRRGRAETIDAAQISKNAASQDASPHDRTRWVASIRAGKARARGAS